MTCLRYCLLEPDRTEEMPLVHRQRHLGDCCDTRNVDAVLLGCVTPLGAQGANI
jgi:hypothetical protein